MNIKKYALQKAARHHQPVSGTFELTPRCNLSCEMCYIHMSPDEAAHLGTELTTQEWLSIGREAVSAGMIYLLLTGGEPLLRPDFVQIYTTMAQMGVLVSINTNATLVNESIVRCLTAHPPERVNITLYGASPATYGEVCGNAAGCEAALRGIRLLKEAGINVCINTTFTRHNAADMEKLIAFADEREIPIRMTSYLFPPLRCEREEETSCYLPPEEYGRLGASFDLLSMESEKLERRRRLLAQIGEQATAELQKGCAASCMAGRSAFWVTWDGKLLPCGMLPALARPLRGADFSGQWAGLDRVMDEQFLPTTCSYCPKKPLCPVCVAVTQSADRAPEALCRYCDGYLAGMLERRL